MPDCNPLKNHLLRYFTGHSDKASKVAHWDSEFENPRKSMYGVIAWAGLGASYECLET
jgi:hypothetical protein